MPRIGGTLKSEEVRQWMESVTGPGWYWFVKLLSANDTGATGAHQAGPYIPKRTIFRLFPSIGDPSGYNPDTSFHATFDSHTDERDLRVVWYNQATRNETRITQWGGAESPLLDEEATGSLCVFAFHKESFDDDSEECRIWLCEQVEEEEAVVDRIGPVEPGIPIFYDATGESDEPITYFVERDTPCRLDRGSLPPRWLTKFPTGQEIVDRSVLQLPCATARAPDDRILARRECEFQLFRSLEEATVMPRIQEGFRTVDAFIDFANSVLNRRKSRSGRSLELQAQRVFHEEGLPHSYNEISEGRKRPDFLFPSAEDYQNSRFPADRLHMLGVKTTCKDRWRQILTEADRIEEKHLLTIQEGVSRHQFERMREENVVLVVPRALHGTYPRNLRHQLLDFEMFIGQMSKASQ